MKIIKILSVSVLTLLIVALIGFYFIRQNSVSHLEEKRDMVAVWWDKLDKKLNERDELFLSLNLTNSDSLKFFIKQSKSERKSKPDILEFQFNEYKINKLFLLNGQEKMIVADSLFKELNSICAQYNSFAQDYNLYYTMFPNIIFAKQKGYKREKYLTIGYGKENQDPIEKSGEIPEWAKDVDTTFLSE